MIKIKIKDGDGTYTLDHYLQITGLTPMENGKLKTILTKEEKKDARDVAKTLKKETKVDKKAAKSGVGKSTSGIHVDVYPYMLSEENVSASENGLKDIKLSGKSGKYQLEFTYDLTDKKSKAKNGKKDAQKDEIAVTYDKTPGCYECFSLLMQPGVYCYGSFTVIVIL